MCNLYAVSIGLNDGPAALDQVSPVISLPVVLPQTDPQYAHIKHLHDTAFARGEQLYYAKVRGHLISSDETHSLPR